MKSYLRLVAFSILLIVHLSLTGCPLNKSQFKAQIMGHVPVRPPNKIPLFSLKSYAADTHQQSIMHVLPSKDRFGHQRLQIYTSMQEKPSPDYLMSFIAPYQHQAEIIWLYLALPGKDPLLPTSWSARAVWYAAHLEPQFKILDFKPTSSVQNLHWYYE